MTAKDSGGRKQPMAQIDGDIVKKLAAILNETGLTEIEYDTGSLKVRVAKAVHQTTLMAAPMHAPAAVAGHAPSAATCAVATGGDIANHPGCVKSPMVGVVYLSTEPGKPTFVKVGDQVSEGQTLLLIEAMKTYNPVKAPKSGRIAQIVVAEAGPVEFGEPLMVIE